MTEEKVFSKIKKLLNIAAHDSASDGDIQAAMLQAQRLMDKYHVTEEDLKKREEDVFKQVDAAEFNDFRSFVGGRVFAWESWLSTYVSKFVGVPVYQSNKKELVRERGIVKFDDWGEPLYGKSFVFYGVAEDAQLAKELYNELRKLIVTMALARYGTAFVKDGGVYSEGFVMGLLEKWNEEQDHPKLQHNPQGTALISLRNGLIQYKKEKAQTWLSKNRGVKLQTQEGNYGSTGSNQAYNQGKEDGRNTDPEATRRKKLG